MTSETLTEIPAEVILASASPRRLELLRSLGLTVRVVPSDYPEPSMPAMSPAELALHHARAKAQVVAPAYRDRLVVAADTVVDLDGVALGKPVGAEQATAMLTALSGRRHTVHTAVALAYADRFVTHRESTLVTFFELEQNDIARYVASGEPFDKAGAYGIQGRGAVLVERIEGDFYTVMGLPIAMFVRLLSRLGLCLPSP